ncbi:hypothetical protein HHK36_028352 [Tetracentron sinense]|uniref:Uncharacterized protein n=1 Tax=Tetracentron sinense TaxID=13715 RepID=A0A835D204_TETSI|nr:hypothetical protein HHK36_028352 [Tetracentron sinense]
MEKDGEGSGGAVADVVLKEESLLKDSSEGAARGCDVSMTISRKVSFKGRPFQGEAETRGGYGSYREHDCERKKERRMVEKSPPKKKDLCGCESCQFADDGGEIAGFGILLTVKDGEGSGAAVADIGLKEEVVDMVTSIHENWFCARCVNTSKPTGEGVIVMQTAAFLLVALYDGSIGSASRAMMVVDQFALQLSRRNL